jgi:hypothetical protein
VEYLTKLLVGVSLLPIFGAPIEPFLVLYFVSDFRLRFYIPLQN